MDRGRNSIGIKAIACVMSWSLVMGLMPLSVFAEDSGDALTDNEASTVVEDTYADSADAGDSLTGDGSDADELFTSDEQQTDVSQGEKDSQETGGETGTIQPQSQEDSTTSGTDEAPILEAQGHSDPNALSGDALDGCTVRIRNGRSPHSLAIHHDGGINASAILYNIPDSFRFYLEKADEDSYYIRFFRDATLLHYCTDMNWEVLGVEWKVGDGYTSDSAVMHLLAKEDTDQFKFQFIPSGNGMFKIMNKESGKYWVLGDTNNSGTWDDNDRVHQSASGWDWEIEIVNAGGSTDELGNEYPYKTFADTSAAKESYDSYSFSYNGSTVTSTNWMSALPDNIPVTDLNIPGTHDTGTCRMEYRTVTEFDAQCQRLYVDDQLAAGVRYFDLRCHDIVDINGVSSPKLNHTDDCVDRNGKILTADDVLTYVRSFLTDEASKNETVILQISRQGDANARAIFEYWKQVVYDHPDWFYIGTHVPDLGEVRGKILLLSKIPLKDDSFGDGYYPSYVYDVENDIYFHWAIDVSSTVNQEAYETAGDTVKVQDGTDYEVWCEDDYKVAADTKWSRSTKPALDKASQHRDEAIAKRKYAWIMIYTSCSNLRDEFTYPINGARYTNHRIKEYFDSDIKSFIDTSANNGKYAGVLLMDFVDEQQCQFVYRQNFIMDMPTFRRRTIDGMGTEQDPYRISNIEEWNYFCENMLLGIETDAYYELDADVGTVRYMVGNSKHPFKGHFNGNGHTLSMSIGTSSGVAALFRYIEGAEISNLNLTGNVQGEDYSSACVGYAVAGSTNSLTDIHTENLKIWIDGTYCGGLIGNSTTSNTTMRGCSCSCEFHAEPDQGAQCQVGGLWGWADDGGSIVMDDCFAYVWTATSSSVNWAIGNLSPVGLIEVSPEPVVQNVYYLSDGPGWDTHYGNPIHDASDRATCVYRLPESDVAIYRPVQVCTGETYYVLATVQGLQDSYQCTGLPIDLGYTVKQLSGERYDSTKPDGEKFVLEGPELTKGVDYTTKVLQRTDNFFNHWSKEISEEQLIEPGTYRLVIEGNAQGGFAGTIKTLTFQVVGEMPNLEVSVKVNRKSITVDKDKLKKGALKLCTTDELAQVYAGAPLKVWLDINVTTEIADVPAADAALLQQRAGQLGSSLGEYALITLYKQVGDGPATRITELPEGMDPIQLRWSVPQELKSSNRTFGVLSVHDGAVLEHASGVTGDEVGFSVTQLSTFGLMHKDTKGTVSGSSTSKSSSASKTSSAAKLPKTGDIAVPMTLVLAMASAGMMCLVAERMLRRRKKL